MAGLTSLRKWLLGEEGTPGTAVAAEVVMQGSATMGVEYDVRRRAESLGLMLPEGGAYYIPKLLATLSTEAEATYEQLPIYFNTCIDDEAGTQDGTAGTGYVYTHDFPETAARSFNTATIEYGDNQQALEMEYSFVREFTLSWAGGEPVMIAATWNGRQWTKTTFTSKSTMVTEEIFGPEFSMNAPGTAFNTNIGDATMTKVSNNLLAYSLTYSAMVPVWSGDAITATANSGKYFGFAKQAGVTARLELTAEWDDNGELLYDALVANTIKKIQIMHEGSALATAGTSYTYKTLDIGCFVVFDSVAPIGEQDGNSIIVASGHLVYDDATDDDAGRIIVVNEKSDVYA